MKKEKYLLSTILVSLLLVGCGGNNSSSSNKTPSVNLSLSEGDIERDENGSIIYNDIKLKMWSVTTGDDAKTQDSIIAEFNSTYNGMINVEVEHISRYDMEQMLQTTMEFEKELAPDLLFSHGHRASEYNERGWLTPIEPAIKKADILIVACGKKWMIDKSMIKKDSIIIDVGINSENGKLYGDVNPNVESVCSMLTPVPGGVGPMTVACLLQNTYKSYKEMNDINE